MQENSRSVTFDAKASGLIKATRNLTVPQILMIRRMTLHDPESLKWATAHQLEVVFEVILKRSLEQIPRIDILTAADNHFEDLLPPPAHRDLEDSDLLNRLTEPMLGGRKAGNRNRTEIEKAHDDMDALLARRLPPSLGRVPRPKLPYREPPPLFDVQGKASANFKGIRGDKGDGHDANTPARVVDFTTLFDDTLCVHVRQILELLRIPPKYKGIYDQALPPFMVAPNFSVVMEDVMRSIILPQIKSSRQVKALASAYNWAEVGGEQLIEIIQGPEVNNPILHNWDLTWNSFKNEPASGEDIPWTIFKEDAKHHKYSPPSRAHIRVLTDLIRYEPEALSIAWRELHHLYQQELEPSGRQERAREGAFRDGILKWSAKLPDFVGDFLAIKAAYSFTACDPKYMRELLNNFGRSEKERRRNAPFLTDFINEMGV